MTLPSAVLATTARPVGTTVVAIQPRLEARTDIATTPALQLTIPFNWVVHSARRRAPQHQMMDSVLTARRQPRNPRPSHGRPHLLL